MNSTLVYGVYTQFEPTHKYEPTLESIWTTQGLAEEALTRIADYMDHKWVSELYLNSDSLHLPRDVDTKEDEGLGLGHDDAMAEQLLAEGTCPCGKDNDVGCSVTGCPLYLYKESRE